MLLAYCKKKKVVQENYWKVKWKKKLVKKVAEAIGVNPASRSKAHSWSGNLCIIISIVFYNFFKIVYEMLLYWLLVEVYWFTVI